MRSVRLLLSRSMAVNRERTQRVHYIQAVGNLLHRLRGVLAQNRVACCMQSTATTETTKTHTWQALRSACTGCGSVSTK